MEDIIKYDVGNLYGVAPEIVTPQIFQREMLCHLISREESAAVKKILTLGEQRKQFSTFKKLLISQAPSHTGFLAILKKCASDYGHLLSEIEQKMLISFFTTTASMPLLAEMSSQCSTVLKELWNMDKDEEGEDEEEEEDEDFDLEKLQLQARRLHKDVEKHDVTTKPARKVNIVFCLMTFKM